MGIKDLFSKDKNTSIVSLTNKEDLSKDIESPEYYSSQITLSQKTLPSSVLLTNTIPML